MAPDQGRSSKRTTSTGVRRIKTKSNVSVANHEAPLENPADVDALRRARLEYLEKAPEERRKRMKYIGEIVEKVPVARKVVGNVPKQPDVRRRHKTTAESKHTLQEARVPEARKDLGEEEFVYRQQVNVKSSRSETATQVSGLSRRPTTRRKTINNDRSKEEDRKQLPRRQSEPLRVRDDYDIDIGASDQRTSPVDVGQSALPKSVISVRDRPNPPLQHSTTSARSRVDIPTASSHTAPEHPRKPSGIFSRLMPSTPTIPEKRTSCLTCGSDDVLISRSAKLACSHRMCHDCLRRIFNMSVSDPAHMPPRCCTSEHIPLKHVDKLFDQNFKKNWNRKFQEYNTRNRIYCPARGCGEWIKPNHITVERGRKIGKCKRCNTRVCCTCNSKMHTSRECPKDPATIQFVEVAKQKGWQRCYRCKAMVELKEGCNHMTCRCTAEFCMVCGLKWKSCDCPWFNYENVDAHLGNPMRYQEELDRRRDQEQRDEVLARRMEVLGVREDDNNVVGVGILARHHMNEDFVRTLLTGNFRQARLAAEGLVNGTVTGRENPLPGMPLPRDQTRQLLRQQSQRMNTDGVPAPLAPRRPRTHRRQSGNDVIGARQGSAEPEIERRRQN